MSAATHSFKQFHNSLRVAGLRSFFVIAIFCITFAAAQSGLGQFTLAVYQPGSPLDGQIVNAAGEAFYLGGSPATYCPLTDQTLCPPGNQTIFAGMGAMFVEVPGGQQVYITSAGALSFTEAHSASIPSGAFLGDFTNITVISDCSAPFYLINWQAPEAVKGIITKGILACPHVPSEDNSTLTFQIYANTPAFNETNCTMIDGLSPHYTSAGVFGAWEYI